MIQLGGVDGKRGFAEIFSAGVGKLKPVQLRSTPIGKGGKCMSLTFFTLARQLSEVSVRQIALFHMPMFARLVALRGRAAFPVYVCRLTNHMR